MDDLHDGPGELHMLVCVVWFQIVIVATSALARPGIDIAGFPGIEQRLPESFAFLLRDGLALFLRICLRAY